MFEPEQPAYITQSLVNCEMCDGLTRWQKVRRRHMLHGVTYAVEGVDAEVCEKCGEKYFHACTLDDLDRRLKLNHK
jgi:YgiT-type zinc finger domain-containing protein